MAAVKTRSEVALNRLAIVGVLIVTIIFLAPIYWITATAFKPRNLATTIPPTVVFEPEISPFVKLFLRRRSCASSRRRRNTQPRRGGSSSSSTAARRSCATAMATCSSRAIRAAS